MDKQICVIGASAGVGLQCVHTALARGHRVVTLSRRVDSLPENPGLTRIQGSATQVADLRRAVKGADAVLVCLGTGMSAKATTLYSDFGRVLGEIEDELGTTPVIILTGFGAGESGQYHSLLMGLLFRFVLKEVYIDKTRLEQIVEKSRLNWMLVRPGLLTNRPSTGPARIQLDYRQGMQVGSIPRQTVAKFMIDQAETPLYLHQRPALSER